MKEILHPPAAMQQLRVHVHWTPCRQSKGSSQEGVLPLLDLHWLGTAVVQRRHVLAAVGKWDGKDGQLWACAALTLAGHCAH